MASAGGAAGGVAGGMASAGGAAGGLAGGAAGGATAGGASGGAALAHLWIDGNGGACARASSRSGYVDSVACPSLQAAFAACQPGDQIIVKAGTYGAQAVTGAKATPGCRVTGEPGTVIGQLTTAASFLTVTNLTIEAGSGRGAVGWGNSGNDVTLDGVRIRGPFASVTISGARVTWRNGELGAAGAVPGRRSCNAGDLEPVQLANASDVTFDRIVFHPQDYDPTPCPGSTNGFHLEMVRIDHDTSGFTLQRSTFEDGDHSNTASVFITNVNGNPGDPTRLVFQNNDFGTAENASFSVHQNVSDCSSFVWAYNTFHNGMGDPTSNGCTQTAGMRVIGNLGARAAYEACAGSHVRNLWQDDRSYSCGSDVVVVGTRGGLERLGLVPDGGFALAAGSVAIDRGEDGGYCLSALGRSITMARLAHAATRVKWAPTNGERARGVHRADVRGIVEA
jgi:hypothetical protein